jgi:hypothetical protein
MKKTLTVLLVALIFVIKTFSQDTVTAFDKDYYMTKSKQQKSTGMVLFWLGMGIATIGLIVQAGSSLQHVATLGNEEENHTGAWVCATGGFISLLSIPLHVSASANKKKALSLSLNREEIFLHQNTSFASKENFSISLRLKF